MNRKNLIKSFLLFPPCAHLHEFRITFYYCSFIYLCWKLAIRSSKLNLDYGIGTNQFRLGEKKYFFLIHLSLHNNLNRKTSNRNYLYSSPYSLSQQANNFKIQSIYSYLFNSKIK